MNNGAIGDPDGSRFEADDFILQQGASTTPDIHWTGFYASDKTRL